MTLTGDDLRELVEHERRQMGVPGTSVAVQIGDDVLVAASGILHARTRVEASPDALFQIGSVTKVWTTTLVLQLADEGRLDLDAPVRTYVPDLTLQDTRTAETITVRQLLTHTSGLQGDHFADFGPGDDAVSRYVESLAGIGNIHPPGVLWSYCNSGFVLAGHIVERLYGTPFDRAVHERLVAPLGLQATVTSAEEAILRPTAVGHQPGAHGPEVVQRWSIPRAMGPAGSTLNCSAADLATFGAMHARGGTGAGGHRVLSQEAAAAMQTPVRALPTGLERHDSMGLGWARSRRGGTDILWHTGGTIGQAALLQVVPAAGVVFAALSNGPGGARLHSRISDSILSQILGTPAPAEPQPPETVDFDLSPYEGVFERLGSTITITAGDQRLTAAVKPTGVLADVDPALDLTLTPLDSSRFLIVEGLHEAPPECAFLEFDDEGKPQYLLLSRVARRVER